jgi:hypothetical protein
MYSELENVRCSHLSSVEALACHFIVSLCDVAVRFFDCTVPTKVTFYQVGVGKKNRI